MRSCREVLDVMPAYLNGQPDPDAVRALDRHLADCPRCLDFVAEELVKAYGETADHWAPRAFARTGAGSALR